MQVFRGIDSVRGQYPSVVWTVGNFDGVHLGHQHLIQKAREKANNLGAQLLIMTFEPHPIKVLAPERFINRLYSLDATIQQMEKLQVDGFVILPFTKELAELDAHSFFRKFLLEPNPLRALVVGYDFAFGAGREGTQERLAEWSKEAGADFEVVEALKSSKGAVFSSTHVRNALLAGDVVKAAQVLGRSYELEGVVTEGDQRGRDIGFPTANLILPGDHIVPKYGVYLTRVELEAGTYFAVTNIGVRPTFEGTKAVVVEAHIIDFSQDIYGKTVSIELLEFLRPEQAFSSVEELKSQISQDLKRAKNLVASYKTQDPS